MVYSEDSAYLYFLYSNLQNYPFIVKTDIASKNSIRREVFANQAFSIQLAITPLFTQNIVAGLQSHPNRLEQQIVFLQRSDLGLLSIYNLGTAYSQFYCMSWYQTASSNAYIWIVAMRYDDFLEFNVNKINSTFTTSSSMRHSLPSN